MKHGRFVAIYARFSHGVRDSVTEDYATGKQKVLVDGLEAWFSPNLVTDEDREQALRHLRFPGLPEDRETEGLVDPRSRLGVWDSKLAQKADRLSDEDTEAIVKALLESDQNVANGGNVFVEVEVAKLPTPWASYDNLEDVDRIVELTLETESDPFAVIAYEKENRSRPEVIEAMASLIEKRKGEATQEDDVLIEA